VNAEEDEENWQGTGASDKDGALSLELTNGTSQRRVVSTLDLAPKPEAAVATQVSRQQQ
jgi:hypothetical protein